MRIRNAGVVAIAAITSLIYAIALCRPLLQGFNDATTQDKAVAQEGGNTTSSRSDVLYKEEGNDLSSTSASPSIGEVNIGNKSAASLALKMEKNVDSQVRVEQPQSLAVTSQNDTIRDGSSGTANHQLNYKYDNNDDNKKLTGTSADGTIMIQLSGELGNHLHHLAHGYGIYLWAKEKYGLNMTMALRHQDSSKWVRSRIAFQSCFPAFQTVNFTVGNSIEFQTRIQQQANWTGANASLLNLVNYNTPNNVAKGGIQFDDIQTQLDRGLSHLTELVRDYPQQLSSSEVQTSQILLPYVHSTCFCPEFFLNKYYDEIRRRFQLHNTSACCKDVPAPDETVFHFRNFEAEMGPRWKGLGFEELSAQKIANELFAHLQPGDKVAIAARQNRGNNKKPLEAVMAALRARGLIVRVSSNGVGNQDFCFLKEAQKELVGFAGSTFVQWAAYLGNTSRVRLYIVDSPRRRQRRTSNKFLISEEVEWTHPELSSRIKYEVYRSEEAEKEDAKAAASR